MATPEVVMIIVSIFKKHLMGHLYTCCYMLIAARDKSLVNKLKAQLSSEFDMKDLGPAEKILGMEINRDRQAGKLFLSQEVCS